MPSPLSSCGSINENNENAIDQNDESECDFFAFYENEILDSNYQNCDHTENVADKESSRSTQKSDTDGKLSEVSGISTSNQEEASVLPKYFNPRKISEE